MCYHCVCILHHYLAAALSACVWSLPILSSAAWRVSPPTPFTAPPLVLGPGCFGVCSKAANQCA